VRFAVIGKQLGKPNILGAPQQRVGFFQRDV
jgi:hypothetical protein